MPTQEMAGSTALVTGGTSGIGEATARELAERGAHVIVAGRDQVRGETVVSSIRSAGGKADFIQADLRDAASARDLARRATESGGGHIDILVNVAGSATFGPTQETAEEIFDGVFATNIKAPYFLVADIAPAMASRGHGAIVNVTTMAATLGIAGMSVQGPAGRVADPTEIAAAITYLASEAASFVHGAVLSVDGGRTAV